MALYFAGAYLLCSICGLFVLDRVARNSPEGWEDEEGFHYGQRPSPAEFGLHQVVQNG
jgi:hypothetical protein